MKALTLTQPWASLVATRQKRIETRSWSTSYRGSIAIHAAKGFPNSAKKLVWQEPFLECLRQAGLIRFNAFVGAAGAGEAVIPVGAVIATGRLVNCVPTGSLAIERELDQWGTPNERAFGDYSPGRWAWVLAEVVPLEEPIPAKGALGLWEWQVRVHLDGQGCGHEGCVLANGEHGHGEVFRRITQYYSTEGALLAQVDPCEAQLRDDRLNALAYELENYADQLEPADFPALIPFLQAIATRVRSVR